MEKEIDLQSVMDFEARIYEISKDRVHGATFLTKECAEAFKELALKCTNRDVLSQSALKIAECRPMMASVFGLANVILFELEKSSNPKRLVEVCEGYITKVLNSSKFASQKASALIAEGYTVLTHSFSSLVKDALIFAYERGVNFNVICTESRPAMEGRSLAKELSEAGIESRLIVDAAAPFLVKKCDLVLVGADGIGGFGLVHKIGTLSIAMAAKSDSTPFVSISPKVKFWPSAFLEPKEPLRDEDGLKEDGDYRVINLYFDITGLEYIEKIVTEDGVMASKEAESICSNITMHPSLRSTLQFDFETIE